MEFDTSIDNNNNNNSAAGSTAQIQLQPQPQDQPHICYEAQGCIADPDIVMTDTETEEVEVEEEKEGERVVNGLKERLNDLDDNRRRAQESLHEICDKLRREVDEMEARIGLELEAAYRKEDARLQKALHEVYIQAEKGNL